jgi:DNA-binding cell septation regulator SpoVG
MKVTNVKLSYVKPKGEGPNKLKGYAKVWLDGELIISSIKIIDTGKKRHLVFPERRVDNEGSEPTRVSLVNPVVSSLREHITSEVLQAYDADPNNPIKKEETDSE